MAIEGGTLTLGSAGRLSATPDVTVDAGARLARRRRSGPEPRRRRHRRPRRLTLAGLRQRRSTTFAGAVDGSGGLVKQGTGTFTLTGANAYTGLTRVESGTLSVGDGGSTGSLATSGFVVDGTLRFAHADAVTLANPSAAAAAIEQAGGGHGSRCRAATRPMPARRAC